MEKKKILLDELAVVKKRISDLKSEINQAKNIRYKTGQYETFSVFNSLQKQLARSVFRQDEITSELSVIKTKNQNVLHRHFLDVCREEIDEEDFEWILNEAKKRTENPDSQESVIVS